MTSSKVGYCQTYKYASPLSIFPWCLHLYSQRVYSVNPFASVCNNVTFLLMEHNSSMVTFSFLIGRKQSHYQSDHKHYFFFFSFSAYWNVYLQILSQWSKLFIWFHNLYLALNSKGANTFSHSFFYLQFQLYR